VLSVNYGARSISQVSGRSWEGMTVAAQGAAVRPRRRGGLRPDLQSGAACRQARILAGAVSTALGVPGTGLEHLRQVRPTQPPPEAGSEGAGRPPDGIWWCLGWGSRD